MTNNQIMRYAVIFFGLLIAISGTEAKAQYEDGSLVGTIHDASGAVVSNATVTVINVSTGIVTKVASNSSGDYEVPALRVGVYTIRADAPGFAEAEAKNITVSVGGRQHIDLTLNVGQANATTVEVSDIALQLETETSERGQSISGYQTEALPLVSRNYSDLLALVTGSRQAPTAATTTAVTSLVRAGAYNINGLRSMFNNFLLDGMDNNAYGESNQGFDNQIIQPTPDAISQFQVVTNNESAEYGRSAGATINVASRSGTNQFHTTLYEFNRNTDLNAFGYYHAVSGVHVFPKPGFNRNQFGATFGGPIVKNKLFYFVDYEGFRQTLTPTTVFTVPTENELGIGTSGTLGTGTGANPLPVLVTDVQNPITGAKFKAGTQIPASAINPTSLQILKFFANLPSQCLIPATSNLISTSGGTLGLATNDCAVNAPFTDDSDKGDLRIDYQQDEKNSWFFKISDRKETAINFNTEPEPLDSQANGNGRIKILDRQVALGYTHLMGANKVIDARLALSGTQAGKYSLAIGNTAITFPGLPTVAADPTVAGGLPTITFGSGFSSVGRQNTNPQWQNPSLLDPKVNFSWVKGKHSFKFGYEYEHIWMEVQDSNPLFGAFAYSGAFSSCSGSACSSISGNDELYWADFLFGTTSQYQLATFFKAHLLQTMHNWYAQDDWKVTPKLTLNLGVRWEYGSPYSEANNNLSNFNANPSAPALLTISNPSNYTAGTFLQPASGSGVYGKTLVNPSLGDYAPRVGFAYAITPTIAIRGGYGTSFVHYTRAGSGDILPINAPNALFITVNQSGPSSATHCATVALTSCFATMDQGFPAGLATASNFHPGTDNITYIPKDTKDGYAESYFLSVQKALAKNTLLDFAYVGNRGLKLQGFVNANQMNPAAGLTTVPNGVGWNRPYPTWGSQVGSSFINGDITEALNEFYSSYNALQVRYEQRFVQGLTLLNSFTWEHSLDNASEALSGITPSPQNVYNLRADYGQSDNNMPVANITSLVYDVPVGHGRQVLGSINPAADAVIGGWQISVINTAQAGSPFTLDYGPNSHNQVSPQILPSSATYRGAILYRPNYLPGNPVADCNSGHTCISHQASSGAINYTNWNAFTLPATYTTGSSLTTGGTISSPFGNAPRNIGRTPKFFETDFDINKRFNTPVESMKIEFRAEAYNIFNHTNLYLPGGTSGSALTGTDNGTSTVTGGGTITGTLEPRLLQFGLKVLY
jgi:hypothetical protein